MWRSMSERLQIMKKTESWWGRDQILEELHEDSDPRLRAEANRQEWEDIRYDQRSDRRRTLKWNKLLKKRDTAAWSDWTFENSQAFKN